MVPKHFNKLSPDSSERIAMLMEEAGEVIQICGKILRHGLDSFHPATSERNDALLQKEITDFVAVARACIGTEIKNFPDGAEIAKAWQKKLNYTHHQEHHDN